MWKGFNYINVFSEHYLTASHTFYYNFIVIFMYQYRNSRSKKQKRVNNHCHHIENCIVYSQYNFQIFHSFPAE